MEQHLPVLLIIVPLIAAPLTILVRERRLALGLGIAVCWSVFGMALRLLQLVLDSGVITYELGGWAPPWGIEYRVDILAAFVLTFVSGIGAIVLSYAPRSMASEIPRERHYLMVSCYLLCLTGLLGITITGDLFNVFVFLEISALSSYALISMGKSRRALTAAFQYLILGTIGATFILIGIGLLYQMTGTLNMVDMAERLTQIDGIRTVLVAFAFLTVGICLKMAFFPLYMWLPNAYAYAPSMVSAFIAATATKVSIYVLLRFMFTVFGPEFSFETITFSVILLPLSLMGMFVASLVAIFQTDVKRLLAFSSISQIGYMALGISMVSVTGLTACIAHMFNHALTKGGLFLAMGCIALRLGSVQIKNMHGIGRTMPFTTFAWVIGGLSLIGVPTTAGFISKWYLIMAALEKGWWPVAVLILLSSLLAVVYVWRVVEAAYFKQPPKGCEDVKEAPLALLIPTYILILSTLYFGLDTRFSIGVARRAAEVLLGIGS